MPRAHAAFILYLYKVMDTAFIIRPPQNASEWQTVRRLLIDYHNEFDDKTCFTSFEEELNSIEQLYAAPDRVKLIAQDESTGEIVGCVALRAIAPGVAEMKRLYVMPSYRGHQLGKLLAERIISKAKQMGFHDMVLDTMLEMKAARKLYEKLGFSEIPPYSDQEARNVICYGLKLNA